MNRALVVGTSFAIGFGSAAALMINHKGLRGIEPRAASVNQTAGPAAGRNSAPAGGLVAEAPASLAVRAPEGTQSPTSNVLAAGGAKVDGPAEPGTPVAGSPGRGASLADLLPWDPFARGALSLVGADPDAEAYWIEAINDPRLPAEERQNLIEDLNEEGLSDFRNPTIEDLPLIMNRILIIEELAPDAMDKVNADAFEEAYKDLVNMVIKILGGD